MNPVTATPERKRPALAPLDANRPSPVPRTKLGGGAGQLGKSPLGPCPIPVAATEGRKRSLEASAVHVVKRMCVKAEVWAAVGSAARTSQADATARLPDRDEQAREDQEEQMDRHQSTSPDASSIFDASAFDTNNNTTVTEPDVVGEASRPTSRTITREQTRKIADDLKARLRLASYKLKTGQMDVPFTQLEALALASASRPSSSRRPQREQHYVAVPVVQVHRPSSSSMDGNESAMDAREGGRKMEPAAVASRETDEDKAGAGEEHEEPVTLPPLLPATRSMLTPRKQMSGGADQKLTSSAIKGGAANELLRLSQGNGS